MQSREWSIYALIDPRDDAVRYVGWSYTPKKRLAAHVKTCERTNTHKGHWLAELKRAGLSPTQIMLEVGSGSGWSSAERRWISHYRRLGCALTNATDGGDGTPGWRPDAETRARMSRAHRGRKMPPEAVAKTAAAHRGRKQSPEQLRKLSAARKGKVPLKACLAAAAKIRGTKQSPEQVAKRVASTRRAKQSGVPATRRRRQQLQSSQGELFERTG